MSRHWTEAALPWLDARQIIITAGEEAVLRGVSADCETMDIRASRIDLTAAQTHSEVEQTSRGFTVGVSSKTSTPTVGIDFAYCQEKAARFLATNIRAAQQVYLHADNQVNLRGAFIATTRLLIDAETLYIESLQDTMVRKEGSFAVSNTAVSASLGQQHSKWVTQQSGFHATESAVLNINSGVSIGGRMTTAAGPVVDTRIVHQDLEDVDRGFKASVSVNFQNAFDLFKKKDPETAKAPGSSPLIGLASVDYKQHDKRQLNEITGQRVTKDSKHHYGMVVPLGDYQALAKDLAAIFNSADRDKAVPDKPILKTNKLKQQLMEQLATQLQEVALDDAAKQAIIEQALSLVITSSTEDDAVIGQNIISLGQTLDPDLESTITNEVAFTQGVAILLTLVEAMALPVDQYLSKQQAAISTVTSAANQHKLTGKTTKGIAADTAITNEAILFSEQVRKNQGGNGDRQFMRLAADDQANRSNRSNRNISDVSIEAEDVLRFGGGVVQGKITGDLFVAVTKAPGIIGKLARGAGVVGAVAMAAEIEQGAYRFRTEHFSQSDLYDDLWSNRLISAEQRAAIFEPASQRELAARAAAGPAKSITQVFKERAGSLGFSAGLLFAPVMPKTTEVLKTAGTIMGDAVLFSAPGTRSFKAQQGFVDLEVFGGKQTKGIAEKQLTEVGRYKPVPLLPNEKAKVLEFQQARNQYLKWHRGIDTSVLSRKSQDLFIDTHTEQAIRDKATPNTLAGLYKRSREVEIYNADGTLKDYITKTENAEKSMTNLLVDLKDRLQTLEAAGQVGTAEANLVQEKLSKLSKLKDLYSSILQEAEALKCQTGIHKSKP